MIYPIAWDVTPIQVTTKTKTYNGFTEGDTETIKVRMEFGYKKIVTQDGLSIDCFGVFYKHGSLTLNKGDTVTFDSNEYEVIEKREYRLANGHVEYTKVWFK